MIVNILKLLGKFIGYDQQKHLAKATNDWAQKAEVSGKRFFKRRKLDNKMREKMRNFNNVLNFWGIQEREIPGVIRMMKRQIVFSYLPVFIISFVLLYQRHMPVWIVLFIISTMVLHTLNRMWRIRILRQRQYIPFQRWLIGKEV